MVRRFLNEADSDSDATRACAGAADKLATSQGTYAD